MKIQYVIAIHLRRWLTNFYDLRFKWTATPEIRTHPQAWLSQLVNVKSAIWLFRKTICNKILFKNLEKNSRETYEMLQTAFRSSCMSRASVFEWHKRLQEARESVRDGERCGRSKEVNTPELLGQRVKVTVRVRVYYVEVLREFWKRFCWKRPALFKSGQWHFHEDNTPVDNSILVTDYLTKMGIKTVPHRLYSPDLAPCDFWLFPKLRGCCYETIEEMKEAVTMVIDMLTQENFHETFQKLLERYNNCIEKKF